MAQHIESVATSGLPLVDRAGLYSNCRGGDIVLCSGQEDVSKAIEGETKSPFSHVLTIWIPPWGTQWLTLESTIEHGVHVGKCSDYVDGYDGDLVLCRRPALTDAQIIQELNVGLGLLDENYDWIEEVSMAARKLLPNLPVIKPKNELFCSGLKQIMSMNTVPFQVPKGDPDWLTPEQIYTDPSVEAVCAKLKGA